MFNAIKYLQYNRVSAKNAFASMIWLTLAACSSTKLAPLPELGASLPPTVTQPLPSQQPTQQPAVVQPSVSLPPATMPSATLPQTGTTPGTPGGYYQDDGPGPNPPPNLEATPEPVPQVEALNKFANEPYSALGQNFVPDKSARPYSATGTASWYGRQFHGRKTASGEIYDMYAMTAAHPTLPIPSYARVTNLENKKTVIVRVNDRGPFHAGRVMDLSYTAALKLGYVQKGSTPVFVESLVPQDVASNRNVAPKPAAVMAATSAASAIGAPATVAPPIMTAPVPATVAAANSARSVIGNGTNDRPVFLQLGVFSNIANAENFREKMEKDLAWLTEPIEIFIVDKLYRVRVGPYSDTLRARDISGRVKSSLGIAPIWSPL